LLKSSKNYLGAYFFGVPDHGQLFEQHLASVNVASLGYACGRRSPNKLIQDWPQASEAGACRASDTPTIYVSDIDMYIPLEKPNT